MEINQITSIIIEESIAIHRDLGPGLMESVYEIILAQRLRDRGLKVEGQVEVPLIYQGQRFPLGFRLDLLVEERVVVELKSVEVLPPVAFKKLTTYLRLTEREVGLIINFGEAVLKNGLHRVVNKYQGPLPGKISRA
jgi:iron complex transport system substrate-binding protein